jgi:alpha-mannosidase
VIEGLADAIGAPVCSQSDAGKSEARRGRLVVNATSVGTRHDLEIPGGGLPEKSDHLYAATQESGSVRATLDVPGCGFVLLPARGDDEPSRGGFAARIRQKLLGGPQPLAEGEQLQNEFMEVTVNAESGGISGVYSGGTRGNRLSLRLVLEGGPGGETIMECDQIKVLASTPSLGCLETSGILRKQDTAGGESPLARYRLRYTLHRGSRFLRVDGHLEPQATIAGDPWLHYLAIRAAVASESPICRTLVRDKLHRARSRRMVAPLGLVLDEAERQTLVCGAGVAFHRRVGERFLDTLIAVEGESKTDFSLHYGLDVPAPVAAARGRLAPPLELTVQPKPGAPQIGWMLHVAPRDLLLSGLSVRQRSDGRLAASIRIIQTQPQACKAKLRCFRNVDSAVLVDGPVEEVFDLSEEQLDKRRQGQRSDLKFEDDLLQFSMPSHGVADLMVLFATS